MQAKGYHGSTAGLYLTACSGLYEQFVLAGLVDRNPFRSPMVAIAGKLREPKKIPPRIAEHEVRMLLETCNRKTWRGKRDYAALCVLFGAGLRRQELVNLEMGDIIDGNPMVLRLYFTKSGVLNEQSLPDWAREGVLGWYDFMRENGAGMDDQFIQMSKTSLHNMFKRRCRQLSLPPDYTLHSTRVTCINQLIDAGYSDRQIADFSRHKDVSQIETYARRQNVPTKNPGLTLVYGGKA